MMTTVCCLADPKSVLVHEGVIMGLLVTAAREKQNLEWAEHDEIRQVQTLAIARRWISDRVVWAAEIPATAQAKHLWLLDNLLLFAIH